jgi:hypothetical protein
VVAVEDDMLKVFSTVCCCLGGGRLGQLPCTSDEAP